MSPPQDAGAIRGVVYDKDFDAPLAGAKVTALSDARGDAVPLERTVLTSEQGNYTLGELPPGTYTLVFAKEGFLRQVRTGVVVTTGRLTDVDAWLSGEFHDMGDFVVQDFLQLGGGSEAALLQLRLDSPALMDSIGAGLMSQAGASDAAGALRLVAGASVKDGKSAVIRGLPDRYVSSQLNGVRLPSADEDKRAVELDQFPAAVIESIQVQKTFTPDQQGDASGGAVDVRLRGIPEESILQFKSEISTNSQVTGRRDFLTYDGGGVSTWGRIDRDRGVPFNRLGDSWPGAVGSTEGKAPTDYKLSLSGGTSRELDRGVKVGGYASLFYERDSSFYDNGREDSLWVDVPGQGLGPVFSQGTPSDGDFKTSLFDVAQGTELVQWGGLATVGLETENHKLAVAFLYSRTAEDTATLATDTRGKEYYFPGYDPDDPTDPGNDPDNLSAAPYLRNETLVFEQRDTGSLQFHGEHRLETDPLRAGDWLTFRRPELDWTVSASFAELDQPDKRQFGALWVPGYDDPGVPPWVPPFSVPSTWYPFKPGANFNLGNVQRIWKAIREDSRQTAVNLKLPFEQWDDQAGYLKFGHFHDHVERSFNQDTFSNFGDSGASYQGGWDDPWSDAFPFEDHPITASDFDVDYRGDLEVNAWYGMLDLPLLTSLDLVGGVRRESTAIDIVNDPEANATWYPPGATAPVQLNPGDADVAFDESHVLPSVGLIWDPLPGLTLRTSWSRTVARQTFKELTPTLQQEFLGGPVFLGNPSLEMSTLRNRDVRVDYAPTEGSLFSVSWFHKDIQDPIEYVQRVVAFTYTTPVNYPEGRLKGWEFEARQDLGRLWQPLKGLSLGGNATFIDSVVRLPADEVAAFRQPNILAPMDERDMTNAPEHLYNLYLTWDLEKTGTRAALFYTVQGDTLVAGAGESNGNFVPSVYATERDTLNLTVTQDLGEYFQLTFKGKNLTNSNVEEVYRSPYTGPDRIRRNYTEGIEYSIALGLTVTF